MKITNQIKKAIVYQYCGQPYQYKNEFGTYSDVVGEYHTNTHMAYESFRLMLKPLSAITDDDAIEIGNIMGVGDVCEISERDKNKITIVGKNPDKTTSKIAIWFDGEILADSNYEIAGYVFQAYQFLISKGYDLPQHFLDDKTLQQAELAVYKK